MLLPDVVFCWQASGWIVTGPAWVYCVTLSCHSAGWGYGSCCRAVAQNLHITLTLELNGRRSQCSSKTRQLCPEQRDSSWHSLHTWEAGVFTQPDALVYTTWPSHSKLGCFSGGYSNRETLSNVMLIKRLASFFNGLGQQNGTLTITSGRSVCSQLDRFWECQAVGGLLNTLAEWMPYKILLWRVQVRINLSCLLPYSIDQPLHMLVFWFWKFVSLIYTDKCTVTGQNMAFIIL